MNNCISSRGEMMILFFIFLSILLYLISWHIPLMEIDAVQYANISREMLQHKQFLQIYDQGKDYLDKPPKLFWLSSASMYFFGINDAAYRFPSFLFSLLSIYSTFRFARLFYSRQIALLSALVLASSQAMFLINHDVRTDTMLMGWVILSIWQMAAWYRSHHWTNLLMASVAIAGGLLTKGPIALIVPLLSFGSHFILQRNFRAFFRPQYLLMGILIALFLIPMSIGLYKQFDLHPEKIMFDKKGVSGLRFYFWTQSFGRITGESSWHENDHFFFLFQNMLWGFLPWILFFIAGLITDIRELIIHKIRISVSQEWISTGGFLFTYCILAISHYQLPHYIYVVFPLASVITAKSLYSFLISENFPNLERPVFIFHAIVFSLLILAMIWLLWIPFPNETRWFLLVAIPALLILVLNLFKKTRSLPALLVLGTGVMFIINSFLAMAFYPALLQYQLSIPVSRFIKVNHINPDSVFLYKIPTTARSLDFYTNHSFKSIQTPDNLPSNSYLLTTKEGGDSINENLFKEKFKGEHYSVTRLSLPFLIPGKRPKETTPYYLLQKK